MKSKGRFNKKNTRQVGQVRKNMGRNKDGLVINIHITNTPVVTDNDRNINTSSNRNKSKSEINAGGIAGGGAVSGGSLSPQNSRLPF